jgi:hypothetical protein
VTKTTNENPNSQIISQDQLPLSQDQLPLSQDQLPLSQDQLASYWQHVKSLHQHLQPLELTDKLCHLAQILEVVRMEESVDSFTKGKRGRPEIDRKSMARAFLAKTYLRFPDTRTLIESLKQSPSLRQLCGMENVPSESTFSRAFAQFAKQNLGDSVHRLLVQKHVSDHTVMHISHDSTAVEAREKALAKKDKTPKEKVKKSVVALRKERFALQKSLLECKNK